MKKVVIPVLVVLALTVLINAVVPQTQQSSNPNIGAVREDSVLTAYAISPGDEAQFSVNNKSVAKFWGKWKEAGVRNVWLRPYIEIKQIGDEYEDEFDCQVAIRAAYGSKGLYLNFKVIDNSFPGPVSTEWHENDVVDFFIDPSSSEVLYKDPHKYFYLIPQFQFTTTMTQFQCGFYKNSFPDSMHINVYDPSFSYQAYKESNWQIFSNIFKVVSTQKAKDSLGILLNTIHQNSTTRIQEWLIPWAVITGRNSAPAIGTRFAACLQYSDLDSTYKSGNNEWAKRITWGGRDNPYLSALRSELEKNEAPKIWGDIEFGDSIISTITIESPRTISVDDILYTYFGSNWGIQVSEKIPATVKPPKNPDEYFYGFLNDRKFGQYKAPAIAFAVTKWADLPYAAMGNDSIRKTSAKLAYDKFVSIKRYVIVDENGNNDLSDEKRYELKRDSDVPWNNGQPIVSSPQITLKKSQPSAKVVLSVFPSPAPEGIHSIFCDRKDLLTGKISFDNKKYTVLIKPCDADNYSNLNTQFWVDANNDGKFDTSVTSLEYSAIPGTIIIGNTQLEVNSIAADGSSFTYSKRQIIENQPTQQLSKDQIANGTEIKSTGIISCERNKSIIMNVILKNIGSLHSLYNQALKSNKNLKGTINTKIAIDESGQVISVVVLNATTNNTDFEKQIATAIKSWQFGKIDKPGDITEVVYPFMFQQ